MAQTKKQSKSSVVEIFISRLQTENARLTDISNKAKAAGRESEVKKCSETIKTNKKLIEKYSQLLEEAKTNSELKK